MNPTLFAKYDFGIGRQFLYNQVKTRVLILANLQVLQTKYANPIFRNAYELRLLLGQELGKYIELATNIFFDQYLRGDREREVGFSTAASYAIRGEALKVGTETSYRHVSDKVQGSQGTQPL